MLGFRRVNASGPRRTSPPTDPDDPRLHNGDVRFSRRRVGQTSNIKLRPEPGRGPNGEDLLLGASVRQGREIGLLPEPGCRPNGEDLLFGASVRQGRKIGLLPETDQKSNGWIGSTVGWLSSVATGVSLWGDGSQDRLTVKPPPRPKSAVTYSIGPSNGVATEEQQEVQPMMLTIRRRNSSEAMSRPRNSPNILPLLSQSHVPILLNPVPMRTSTDMLNQLLTLDTVARGKSPSGMQGLERLEGLNINGPDSENLSTSSLKPKPDGFASPEVSLHSSKLVPMIPRPNPRSHDAATVPIKAVDYYKLETVFGHDEVVQPTNFSANSPERSTWKKVEILGIGMSGEVWLERSTQGMLRAVKCVSRRSAAAKVFGREVLALATLRNYPNLFLEFFGWYENEHHIFMAMEYAEFGNLREYTKKSRSVKVEAKEITRQILQGLEVLHEHLICHRDLKPEVNVLIASKNPIRVKIADFGVSKQTIGTMLRTRCGTDGYLAPELRGALTKRNSRKPEIFTYALDIWSLGCLLHEMLSSKVPFFDTNTDNEDDDDIGPSPPCLDMDSLMAYCQGRLDFPTSALHEAGVSEDGIAFVKSLLSPRPEDRPTATSALMNPWLLDGGRETRE